MPVFLMYIIDLTVLVLTKYISDNTLATLLPSESSTSMYNAVADKTSGSLTFTFPDPGSAPVVELLQLYVKVTSPGAPSEPFAPFVPFGQLWILLK